MTVIYGGFTVNTTDKTFKLVLVNQDREAVKAAIFGITDPVIILNMLDERFPYDLLDWLMRQDIPIEESTLILNGLFKVMKELVK
jgi:hypothetical protein